MGSKDVVERGHLFAFRSGDGYADAVKEPCKVFDVSAAWRHALTPQNRGDVILSNEFP